MFETFKKLPDDPILGLSVAHMNDPNPDKVDLGVGVYRDENGITPVFQAVKEAETIKLESELTKVYTGIQGDPVFCEEIQKLVLGADHPAIRDGRSCAVATPGGSGALRVAAEVINSRQPGADLWVSKPSWPNHIPLLGTAGLTIQEYPYYDDQNHNIRNDQMLEQISKLGKDDILLLHACCHNPTGADLTLEQWQEITRLALKNGFLPFVDFAYQGLGKGLERDAEGLRHLAASVPELVIAYSCSKNFGLYRDRVGAMILLTEQKQTTEAVWSHMKSTARRLYSVPPAHGAIIVGMILSDPDMRQSWESELDDMCQRTNGVRKMFSETMKNKHSSQDFSFIDSQYGMFSLLGLTKEQVQRLRDEFSVYMVSSSRINVAGISRNNIDYLTDAILAVTQ
ncbi:MAG: amino acid aminotransferase [Gammaproteobacteria bacterium]